MLGLGLKLGGSGKPLSPPAIPALPAHRAYLTFEGRHLLFAKQFVVAETIGR